MRRTGLLLLTVLFSASLLFGCAPKSKSVEITVVSPFHSDDGNHNNFVSAIDAYEAESGVTVIDDSEVSSEEWKNKVISDIKNGTGADVLFFFTGADADELVSEGLVVPISEIRKINADYASNMKDSMMPVSNADGRQYAVPVNGYWEGLYVNKNILKDAGIEIPDADYTWEQFLSDCVKIRDAGYTPIACSLNEIPHYWFEFVTFNHGAISNHATLPKSPDDEMGRIWIEGLNDLKQLYDSGFFPAETLTMTDAEACQMLVEDKAAFLLEGSWKLGWIQTTADDINDFTVTYVPASGERRATDIVGGLSMGYYITRTAFDDKEKRDACIELVMAMTTDEVVNSFGALSVTALQAGTKKPDDADSLVTAALEMTKGCTGIVLAAQDSLPPENRNVLFADIPRVVTGEITPAKAVENCLPQ